MKLRKKGEEAVKIEKEQTTLRLPADFKEQLMKEAQNYGISFNEYIIMLIHRGRQYQL